MEGSEKFMNEMSLQEKLSINKYELDENSHISIDKRICQEVCKNRICLVICPAGVYTENNGEIFIDHAGCLECGTCLVSCPEEALHWNYPGSGFGIIYRYG